MSEKLATQRERLLAALAMAGDDGLTCAEAAQIIGRDNAAASKVLSVFHRRGLAAYAPADDPRYVRSRGSTRGAVHVATPRLFGPVGVPEAPQSENAQAENLAAVPPEKPQPRSETK